MVRVLEGVVLRVTAKVMLCSVVQEVFIGLAGIKAIA